jgi:hypothetical protein
MQVTKSQKFGALTHRRKELMKESKKQANRLKDVLDAILTAVE